MNVTENIKNNDKLKEFHPKSKTKSHASLPFSTEECGRTEQKVAKAQSGQIMGSPPKQTDKKGTFCNVFELFQIENSS